MALKRINKVRGGRTAFVPRDSAAGRCRAPRPAVRPLNDLSLSLPRRAGVCEARGSVYDKNPPGPGPRRRRRPRRPCSTVSRRAEMADTPRFASCAPGSRPSTPWPGSDTRRSDTLGTRTDFVCPCSAPAPERQRGSCVRARTLSPATRTLLSRGRASSPSLFAGLLCSLPRGACDYLFQWPLVISHAYVVKGVT